jgi:hypothetical protein
VLSFFIGPLRPDGSVDHDKGHDYLGHKIGQAGQEFAMTQWRWVDMQAYVSGVVLLVVLLNVLLTLTCRCSACFSSCRACRRLTARRQTTVLSLCNEGRWSIWSGEGGCAHVRVQRISWPNSNLLVCAADRIFIDLEKSLYNMDDNRQRSGGTGAGTGDGSQTRSTRRSESSRRLTLENDIEIGL